MATLCPVGQYVIQASTHGQSDWELALLLRREGSVNNDYAKRFMALSWRNLTITEAQHIQLFTTGLGALLRNDVTLQWPQTIDDAVIYAKAYKQRLMMQVSVSSTVLTRQSHSTRW
jgi:hypothetical protein